MEQLIKNGLLHKSEFKIVYVAPMKAMSIEVSSTFTIHLSPLNMVVRELIGDKQLTKYEFEATWMFVIC